MPVNNYIVLTDSRGYLYGTSKRFKAIQMRNPLQKTDNLRTALDGSVDKSSGTIVQMWRYVIRVPFEVTDENYGTYDDLRNFYLLNNPQASPTDVITLTDHYGATHNVFFTGTFDPENATTILDGYNSHYMVTIEFREAVDNG